MTLICGALEEHLLAYIAYKLSNLYEVLRKCILHSDGHTICNKLKGKNSKNTVTTPKKRQLSSWVHFSKINSMLKSMVNINSESKHNFGHFASYIIYLARFCKDIDISHCVAVHFVYDLHAVRMDQFVGSDRDVNSINLHASLRYFCLHHKKQRKHQNRW